MTCQPVYEISGTLYDEPGGFNTFAGSTVIVRLYASKNAALDPVAEQTLTVTDGQTLSGTTYTFTGVTEGSYFVRAFRDANGDAQPQLPDEDQAPSRAAVVFGASATGVDLTLVNRPWLSAFTGDARTVWYQPGSVPGCDAYHMELSGQWQGGGAPWSFDGPYVRLPGSSADLLLQDDGSCSAGTGYDLRSGDQVYTFGWSSPAASDAGTYTFWYRDADEDLIHVSTDDVASIVALDPPVITAPTGASPLTDLANGQATWAAVPGAGAYQVSVVDVAAGWQWMGNPVVTTGTSAPLGGLGLQDQWVYGVFAEAYDADPTAGDVDAYTQGPVSIFITDTQNTAVSVSGALTNLTGQSGAFILEIYNPSSQPEGSVELPATATSYTLWARQPTAGYSVHGFIDVNGNHQWDDGEPEKWLYRVVDLSAGNATGVDLLFVPDVVLLSPADGTDHAGATPAFTWEAYPATAAPQGTWSYVLLATSGTNTSGLPDMVWAVDNTTTTYDLAAPPASRNDILCVFTGGTYDAATGTCTGGTGSVSDLGTDWWTWQVFVLPCPATDATCILNAFLGPGAYASSPEWTVASVCGPGMVEDNNGQCVNFDACAAGAGGNPCAAQGDTGAVCTDNPPPSASYQCQCSGGYQLQYDPNTSDPVCAPIPPRIYAWPAASCIGPGNGEMIEVQVVDGQGNPITDAQLDLQSSDPTAPTMTVVNGTVVSGDGTTHLVANVDPNAGNILDVQLGPAPGQGATITITSVNYPNAVSTTYFAQCP